MLTKQLAKMTRYVTFSALLPIAALIVSCTTLTPSEPPSNLTTTWAKREAALSKIHSWNITGKIAVQTARDAGSATLRWSQSQQHYAIALMGPLGANGMQLEGQPGHVTLTSANGKQFTASSPEQLLANQWGYDLPVSYLTYWIRGLPVPGIPAAQQLDAHHRLSTLNQQGWHIQFLSYMNRNGIELPQKISATSNSLKTKVVIYSWNIQ